ncbi:Serine protease 23 [Oopsacas minuta]|uniref:Serine protease 23 n=1 Tax=Oopsacas minuta TaxID=111878 RepID=A0AAV7KL36_9METZ|nr:Serine protease 23 [Oopsacas minuta]
MVSIVNLSIVCLLFVVCVCDKNLAYFSYEQHDLEDGEHLTNILHNPFLEGVVDRDVNNIPEGSIHHYVKKREIFGEDDRNEVDRESISAENRLAELSTVLISVGCTGMLVTKEHVLTAAHCIHTEGYFKKGYSSLEVGIEMSYGIEWRQVLTMFLPSNWTNPDITINPDYYDYAILKIDPITTTTTTTTPYLPIALTTDIQHGVNTQISIVAYFDDKPLKTKWMTKCDVIDEDVGIMWHKCDVTYGASGAGMYSMHMNSVTNQNELRTVGILSGYNYDYNTELELNYAVRINPINYFYICSWTCQMDWCMGQLSEEAKREIRGQGDGWVLDKLMDSAPPYCAS